MADYRLEEREALAPRLKAGLLTGLIAGLVMLLFMMIWSGVFAGQDAFRMLNLIATWGGYEFIPEGMRMETAVGAMIHLIVSMFLGLVWGMLAVSTPSVSMSMMGGILYGYIIFLLMEGWIAPTLNSTFAAYTTYGAFLAAHIIFGLMFFLYPLFIGKFARNPAR